MSCTVTKPQVRITDFTDIKTQTGGLDGSQLRKKACDAFLCLCPKVISFSPFYFPTIIKV